MSPYVRVLTLKDNWSRHVNCDVKIYQEVQETTGLSDQNFSFSKNISLYSIICKLKMLQNLTFAILKKKERQRL